MVDEAISGGATKLLEQLIAVLGVQFNPTAATACRLVLVACRRSLTLPDVCFCLIALQYRSCLHKAESLSCCSACTSSSKWAKPRCATSARWFQLHKNLTDAQFGRLRVG